MNQQINPNSSFQNKGGIPCLKGMRGLKKRLPMTFLALALTGWTPAWSSSKESGKEEKVTEFVRTNMDDLESRVRSTLLFGGSAPVSFMGEARLFAQYHDAGETYPEFMSRDHNWTSINWAGNSSMVRIGMIAKAGRSAVLWAKLGFQSTFSGTWTNNDSEANKYYDPGTGFEIESGRHDGNDRMLNIHEDMSAGLAIRTKPASFWVRMGNTMWTEASPFTIWKSQPRTFAWDYLPFEVEQPIQRYYEYNIAKGEKDGRAAWNKKPFNGINIESINLPGNMYANFVYATHERYDNFEREYMDWSGDVGYTEFVDGQHQEYAAKSQGNGDRWRHIIHGRLAYENPETGQSVGANYIKNIYNEQVFTVDAFTSKFRDLTVKTTDSVQVTLVDAVDPANNATEYQKLKKEVNQAFFKEATTFSLDYFQKFGSWTVKSDIALNFVDTTWQTKTTSESVPTTQNIGDNIDPTQTVKYDMRTTSSDIRPAVYAHIEGDIGLPLKLDLAYIAPHFYSPFSFVAPVEGFYAFNSNMVGAGKFIGRGEGSPYVGNMAGFLASVQPDVGYGHLKVTYGFHTQLEEGIDQLYIPYRLNGQDLFGLFHSSYQRWGNGTVYGGIKGTDGKNPFYFRRLGDESYTKAKKSAPSKGGNQGFAPFNPLGVGADAGGITTDYLGMYENFVAYSTAEEAEANRKDAVGLLEVSSKVPRHQKSTWNFELDYAKDISSWFNYKKDILTGFYYAANAVNEDLNIFGMGDDAMLYSHYFRFEPAVAVTNKFYIIGLFGIENWKSNKAWTFVPNFADFYDEEDYKAEKNTLIESYNLTSVDAEGNTVYSAPQAMVNDAALVADYTDKVNALKAKQDQGDADLKAYNEDPDQWGQVVRTPIDYVDIAYGIGFDWDIAPRVGLHYRLKWLSHSDEGLKSVKSEIGPDIDVNGNDYDMMIMSGEIKMWF